MVENNRILIGCKENSIYLMAEGHITANLSFPLREDLYKKISTLKFIENIFMDLSKTDYMDSTFMGLLVGIERKLFSTFKAHLYVINPTEIANKLLKSMRMDIFLKIEEKPIPSDIEFSIFDENIEISENERTKIVLVAHKDLSSLSEENAKRFKALEDILEKQIKDK
ncbi:MAG: hypothetical protein A2086_10770 [Spirochaetes bacterium GWD1_27_9]|nr:MAG: hypothetical protein A2Z98_07395 [Spirochaetes bacterium GWB1_27_13]OHD21472.1 MAG: hypothetical protein A2Y34_01305 [Spirochaetes bacterium GWC1_27_15]OHD35185.1 MAG: hypothetical protein A2086_10770 [Spirochaetes bacterium GWD1_27_9]